MTRDSFLAQQEIDAEQKIAAAYLSLAIRMVELPCLVVGGGRIGARKAVTLCRAGAKVTVLSPEISPRLREFVDRGQIEWRESKYATTSLPGFRLVVAATADHRLNCQIGEDAESEGILSCVVSGPGSSRVIFPAVCNEGDVTVAVHSQGRNCRQSQAVRNRIAVWLSAAPQVSDARAGYRECADEVCQRFAECDARPSAPADVGRVSIVGAGPGAADLISLRGYHALQSADAILIDQLLPATFLEDLGISSAGKVVERLGTGGPHWTQEEINRWLATAAKTGQTVVRLKGGDPFVFGRGDSEIESLTDHDIPWEVIPGASAATAVLCSAGLPLTRHGQRRSFAVATARVEGGRISESFPQADSLVIFMGITVLGQVMARLLADGWPRDTPAAIVERGTLTWERQISGPLGRLDELAERAGVASPALVVVGEAARPIATIRCRPTILYTGLDPANFRMLGNVVHWPAQAIVSNPKGQRRLPSAFASLGRGEVDWVVFTDKHAVRTFWTAAAERRLDTRIVRGAKIAALGAETSRRLEQYCLFADVVITETNARRTAGLLGELSRQNVLVVQGSHTPRGFCSELMAAGAAVTHLILHRLVPHPELGRPLPNHNVAYFVSPAGVRAYAMKYGKDAFQREAWCLGEATQRALAACGVHATVVLPTQTDRETVSAWKGERTSGFPA